jgi:hypothetical protein
VERHRRARADTVARLTTFRLTRCEVRAAPLSEGQPSEGGEVPDHVALNVLDES